MEVEDYLKIFQSKSQKTGSLAENQAGDGIPSQKPQTQSLCAEMKDDGYVGIKDKYSRTHKLFPLTSTLEDAVQRKKEM